MTKEYCDMCGEEIPKDATQRIGGMMSIKWREAANEEQKSLAFQDLCLNCVDDIVERIKK